MKKDKTPLHLRTLCIGSWIALSLSFILSIIDMIIEGEAVNITMTFPYFFAGLIGINAYEVSSHLYKRVIAIETQTASQKNDANYIAEQ